MALTITEQADPTTAGEKFSIGDRFAVIASVLFDNSYPTGGEAILPSDFGLEAQIDAVVPLSTGGGRILEHDKANSKLKLFTALGTEAANASDQSTITARVLVIGK